MHDEIFSPSQKVLLPLISSFSGQFGLVGGTAIALQVGHRRSIDFDLFTLREFDIDRIKETVRLKHKINTVFVENPNELTILVDGVKVTFYRYPFQIKFTETFETIINMPDLVTLASMKAFALGKRAKWKDYVDLYFIFKKHSLINILEKAKGIFGNEFNEKLFREELSYFQDIDYSETIDYLPDFLTADQEIKRELQRVSLEK